MTAPLEASDLLADPAEVLHRLAEQPGFAHFSDRALWELARRFTLRSCSPGELLCRAGQVDAHFYVLLEGTLVLSRPSGRELGELGPGSMVGDRGLLEGLPRSTDVRSRCHSLLLSLQTEQYRDLMLHAPQLAAQLTQTITKVVFKRSTRQDEGSPGVLGGRYRCLRKLGQGGMAQVWLARDEKLGVDRAIKLLAPRLHAQEAARERFEIEARTMAALRHPHVVTVHDVHVGPEHAYMVQEVAPGGSLAQQVQRRGPLAPRRAAEVIIAVLRALEAAHRQRLVHRDVKPHNILFRRDGTPLLTDFGIARLLDWDSPRARSLPLAGSGGYMAPEQRMDPKGAGTQADLYGAGATLYAALTGQSPPELFAREVQRRLSEELPAPLARVLHLSTCYLPQERYRDAATMRRALERALPELGAQVLAGAKSSLPVSLTQETMEVGEWVHAEDET